MPAEFQVNCTACGHSWELIDLTYRIGPIDYRSRNQRQLWCPQCLIVVHYISRIDRNAWTRWRSSNASEIAESRFATSICDRISAIVSGCLWFAPKKIDLSGLSCPRCPQRLESGDWDQATVICPQCQHRAGTLTEDCALVTVVYPNGIP